LINACNGAISLFNFLQYLHYIYNNTTNMTPAYSNVFRVPNGVAHGAQINVFQPNVVIPQINDFARDGVGIHLVCLICIICLSLICLGGCAGYGGPVRILGGVVIAIARALGVWALNRADSRERGIQFGVFIHPVGLFTSGLAKTRVRNHEIVNGDGVVLIPAVAAIIHNRIAFGQSDVVHVSATSAEMHLWINSGSNNTILV
jgi:hypothetical protein